MDDSQDGSSAKPTEHDSNHPASVSEITTDQSSAIPAITSSNDKTGSAHSAKVSATQAQVRQQAVPSSQGEFPLQTDVSSAQPHLNQGHSKHHPVDSQRCVTTIVMM